MRLLSAGKGTVRRRFAASWMWYVLLSFASGCFCIMTTCVSFTWLYSIFLFSAGSKLRRLRSAIDANLVSTPYPSEYQDVHVIAGVLKSYLRDLPEPLLTFQLYDQFISASQRPTEDARKVAILNAINQLPQNNYLNLRYLTKFLGK